jgi:hypothetical protein
MTRRIDNIIAHGLEKNPSFCLSGGVDDDMLKYCFLSFFRLKTQQNGATKCGCCKLKQGRSEAE